MDPSKRTFRLRPALLIRLAWVNVAILLIAAFLPLGGASLAASVEPITSLQDGRLAGNPKCASIDDWYGHGQTWTGSKIDAEPRDGSYDFGNGRIVTISNWDPQTRTFDWTSTFGVDAVFIKAGQGNGGYNALYVYASHATSPESYGDTGLVSKGPRGVSHVDFCWDPDVPPQSPSPSPTGSVEPSGSPSASPSPTGSVEPSGSPSASPDPSPSPSPTGSVAAITYPPEVTPPPTDIPSGPASPSEWSWRLALLALVAVQAVALKTVPRLLGLVRA
jgi:hypothetical protein